MNKSIMSCIREHIRDQCPLLKDWEGLFPSVGIDAMEEEPASYMIEKTPAEPVLKRYTDGSTVRQEVFTFASRETFTRSMMRSRFGCRNRWRRCSFRTDAIPGASW